MFHMLGEKNIFLKFSSVPNMNVTGSLHCTLENIITCTYLYELLKVPMHCLDWRALGGIN